MPRATLCWHWHCTVSEHVRRPMSHPLPSAARQRRPPPCRQQPASRFPYQAAPRARPKRQTTRTTARTAMVSACPSSPASPLASARPGCLPLWLVHAAVEQTMATVATYFSIMAPRGGWLDFTLPCGRQPLKFAEPRHERASRRYRRWAALAPGMTEQRSLGPRWNTLNIAGNYPNKIMGFRQLARLIFRDEPFVLRIWRPVATLTFC